MHRTTAMNTTAKSSAITKLLINESTNILETFGIASLPSAVEEITASTLTTIESTTEISSFSSSSSSKSSSPFNALNYKESESTRLSPLSSSSESHNQALKSPKSLLINQEASNIASANTNSNSNIPADSSILPFLKESFCKRKRQQKIDIEESLLQSKMLASTSGSCSSSNSSSQQSNVAGATSIPTATSVSSPTNSIKNIKCEPYMTLSPCNENSQNMLEENSNNNSSNNIALESNIRERDGTISSSMLRQNSNSSVNSCSATVNASSPNNGSDHSNSSNISSNISQTVDNTDILPDLNGEKTSKKKNTINFNVKDDDNHGKTSDKPNTQMKNSASNMCLNTAIKEEPGVINNLSSVKEESAVSPNMSPVGFGSIEGTVRAMTPVKVNEVTSNTSGNNEKMASNLISSGGGCSEDTSGLNSNASSDACNSSGGPVGPSLQHAPSNNFNNTGGGANCTGGSLVGNCMDYMQQQNHIFVFSTQLANKGADAVLSGQFPTIIAYHCTQPATKSFLEDFFIKNPMKMTKLQRQNSLNLCSISVSGGGNGGGQHWMGSGGCNNALPKMQQQQQQKSSGGKINFIGVNANVEHKPPPNASASLRQTNMATGVGSSFPEADVLVPNENELMCWEPTPRQSLDAGAPDAAHGLKMLDGSVVDSSSKSIGTVDNAGGANDGNIPSLQGVKVPDENLTPQQRQHREEQLAKLKKMNQFLFPENGNEFRPDVAAVGKLNVDGGRSGVPVSGNLAGIMLNLPETAGQGMNTSQIGNPHNPAMRGSNISTNILNHHQNKTPEHMTASLGSDDASDIMGAHDMGGKATCGNNLSSVSSQPNIACGPTVGNLLGNSFGGKINGPGPGEPICVIPNSPPEGVMGGGFNQNCGVGGGISDGNLGGSGTGPATKDMISICGLHYENMNHHVGIAQMEWSKMQHQFFEERLKGNKSAIDIALATICPLNSTGIGGGAGVNVRSNMAAGVCGSSTGGVGVNTSAGNGGGGSGTGIQALRSAQGPPPPYHHPTQRSASVPIATQSPNPASPNNPTSNLSLPSPRTAGTLGSVPGNSPNMDVQHAVTIQSQSSSSSAPPPPTATTSSGITTTAPVNTTSTALNSNNTQTQKSSSYQQDGSPQNAGGCGSNNNISRNRCGNLNSYNSNPSTPLSHMSPKDMEPFNTVSGPTVDLKNARPSPQRSRTPLLPTNSNNLVESSNIEGRFPAGGLGLNFPTHMQNTANIAANNYKASCPIERQNSAPIPTQFCRRTDNLPLNPNSNRAPQNKLSHTFDPISSLAQMSQQLTSCVSLNTGGGGGVGNSPSGGGGGGMGHLIVPNEMGQMSANVVNQQNMESILSLDAGVGSVGVGGIMDHCGSAVALNHMSGISGGGMPPHMNAGVGPYMSANCHINPMLGTMGGSQQRMLNPKICGGGGFNQGGMREGPGNFHGVMPPAHRMMNRMAVNFGNFNHSPNIQVKASTPNTIQYMPVRPQNNSNNTNNNPNNMRAQPSLEFLQRYANPQMAMDNNGGPHMGQINPGNHPGGDPNKLNQNPNNMPPVGMNFFQNCNQMAAMEEDGGMLPGAHDINLGGGGGSVGGHASLIRGMRPNMRQQHLGHSPSRMQAPGGVGSVMPQFPNVSGQTQEAMECSDAAAMFGAGPGAVPGQMYAGQGPSAGQQKNPKSGMSGGICQNMNAAGGGGNNGQVSNAGSLLQNEQHNSITMQQQQSPVNVPGLGLGISSGGNIMQNHALALGGGGNNASSPGGAGGGNSNVGNDNVVNYKSFVGPASNDLKYAQQYHSFQQQLYATSTRSQQGQGGGGNGNIGNNPNSNPVAFFVNK